MKIKTSKLYLLGVGKESLFSTRIESYRFAVRSKDFVGYPKYRLVTSGETIETPSKGRRAVVWEASVLELEQEYALPKRLDREFLIAVERFVNATGTIGNCVSAYISSEVLKEYNSALLRKEELEAACELLDDEIRKLKGRGEGNAA